MHNNSYLELDGAALEKNIHFLRKHFGNKVVISSVVKGNAYGHSIESFVPLALAVGIDHFSVFDSHEARRVKSVSNDKTTVMIMGWMDNGADMKWAIENEVEFFIFEKSRLQAAANTARKLRKKAIIHIEVETGMNRTGFDTFELPRLFEFLKKNADYLILKGLCTHYAGAESIANYFRIQKQIEKYNNIYQRFCDASLKPILKHSACSAAAMIYPETRMDMVRIGIMQYGLWPSSEVMVNYFNSRKKTVDPLRRIISWKSQIMSVKKIKRGEFIGYGTSYMAGANMKIAVVPIGYSHGYNRSLSNVGRVLINGERCVVIGNINMNMMVVDVSELLHLSVGDEVVLIGLQDNLEISIASFSDYSNLLNYELLTRIAADIPRKIKL